MRFRIRAAATEDAAAIAKIYMPHVVETAVSFEALPPDADEMAQRISAISARYPFLVAETEGRVVGYAYASKFRDRTAFNRSAETTVYLARDAQGQGIGRGLYEALITQCRSAGLRTLIAAITLPNDASIALHHRLGFTSVGVFHDVGWKFERWHDVAFLELVLSGA